MKLSSSKSRRFPRRILVVSLAVLLGCLSVAACGVENRSPPAPDVVSNGLVAADIDLKRAGFPSVTGPPIRFWTTSWPGYGRTLVASSAGYFAQSGLDVKIAVARGDGQIGAGFKAGIVEAAAMKTYEALRIRSEGAPITIISVLDHATRSDAVLVSSAITQVKDLKGKSINITKGHVGEFLLSVALRQAKLTEQDVTLIDIAAKHGTAGLSAGQVFASVNEEPYITPFLAQNPAFRTLFTAADYAGFLSDVLVVRDAVVRDHPGQVAAMLKSLEQANEFVSMRPAEAAAIVGQRLGIAASDAALVLNGIRSYTLPEAKILLGDIATTIGNINNAAHDAGLITLPVDPIAMVDTRFVNALG